MKHASVVSPKYLAHRERRSARSARRGDAGIAALFQGAATMRCGMQRRSNAKGLRRHNTGALLIGLLLAACAGSDANPIIEPNPVSGDSCAIARPNFGAPATQAELSLFAYDVNAPLNLQKTVENAVGAVEVSAISYDSPAGGRVTGLLFISLLRSSPRPGIILMHCS